MVRSGSFRRGTWQPGRQSVNRTSGVPAYAVDEVILGQVLTAGQGRIRQDNRLLKVVFLIAFLNHY